MGRPQDITLPAREQGSPPSASARQFRGARGGDSGGRRGCGRDSACVKGAMHVVLVCGGELVPLDVQVGRGAGARPSTNERKCCAATVARVLVAEAARLQGPGV